MKVCFNSYNAIYTYSLTSKPQEVEFQPAFGSAKARKLIEKIINAKTFKGINATFDDMVAVYNELGYDVILKAGSHASVPITDRANLPLVIPHNSKYVHPLDLKRLQCVLNGDFERALNTH